MNNRVAILFFHNKLFVFHWFVFPLWNHLKQKSVILFNYEKRGNENKQESKEEIWSIKFQMSPFQFEKYRRKKRQPLSPLFFSLVWSDFYFSSQNKKMFTKIYLISKTERKNVRRGFKGCLLFLFSSFILV